MGEVTEISWCDESLSTGRKRGAHKSAAKKAGCALAEWYSRRASGERWCWRCRIWKAIDLFSLDRTRQGGRSSLCKACNSIQATRCRYGLSEEEFLRLQAVKACPICDRSDAPMEIDHNHKTGTVRAVLCSRCNNAIGMFAEDTSLMRRAVAYLEKHQNG